MPRWEFRDYPKKLKRTIKEISSQKALYLYSYNKKTNYLKQPKYNIENIQALSLTKKSNILNLTINNIRYILKKRMPKIILIDDQSSNGWADIFQYMIYGNKNKNFVSIEPEKGLQSIEKYYNEVISEYIKINKPHIILLDLRLKKEKSNSMNIDELSGVIVLNCIRQDYPGIPVIMTTASNKSLVYEEIQRLGADAYWTKEGLESIMNEEDSFRNYLRILEIIERATSFNFDFVRWYSEKIKEIENSNILYCWEEIQTKPGSINKVDKATVVNILFDGLHLLRNYLMNVELKKVNIIHRSEWFYPSIIILHLAKVIELIYNTTKIAAIPKSDKTARRLYSERNMAAHILPGIHGECVDKITIDNTIEWTDQLIKYLCRK